MRVGGIFLGLAWLFAIPGLAAAVAPACIDADRATPCADPGNYLREFLAAANLHRHLPISRVIEALAFPKGTAVGAEFSHSLQASGTLDNPRLHLQTLCGEITINLFDSSIEMAIAQQKADTTLQLPVDSQTVPRHTPLAPGNFSAGAGMGVFSSVKGEVLVDLHPFPKLSGPFTAASVTNTLDPRFPRDGTDRSAVVNGQEIWHDTKRCSRCHVDTAAGGTHGSLGVVPLTVGPEKILAVVSPYERVPLTNAHHNLFRVPADLARLRRCKCEPTPSAKDCERFPPEPWAGAAKDEACARLKVVLGFQPGQHCGFDPARETPEPGLGDGRYGNHLRLTPDPIGYKIIER